MALGMAITPSPHLPHKHPPPVRPTDLELFHPWQFRSPAFQRGRGKAVGEGVGDGGVAAARGLCEGGATA